MRFSLLTVLSASCFGVSAKYPIDSSLFNRLSQIGGVGYAYANNSCPGNIVDKGGYTWIKKAQFDISDGYGGTITVRTLRRITNAAANTGEIYLLFPGSSSPSNFEADFEVKQVSYTFNGKCSNCMMHSGFINAFLNGKTQIINNSKSLAASFPNDQFIIIGGSLGAALAAIAWGEIVSNSAYGLKPTLGVTFGQPRVGNPAWATYMNQVTFSTSSSPQWLRVTHGQDSIAKLPGYSDTGYPYYHFGEEIWAVDQVGCGNNGNRPCASSTSVCPLGSSGSEPSDCINSVGNYLGDHVTYPGYVGNETPPCS